MPTACAGRNINSPGALQALDVFVAPAVLEVPSNAPPARVTPGDCFIVGGNPKDQWVGHANRLAAYTASGWRFLDPPEGITVFVRSERLPAVFSEGRWTIGLIEGAALMIGGDQVVGPRGPALRLPEGGKTVDLEARASIAAIVGALAKHGLVAS